MSFSKLKPQQKFLKKWQEHGFNKQPQLEYRFHPQRKWRFDLCWPVCKVAVEIDGFGIGHQAQQNLSNNHEKQNAAVELGWTVLRYTSRQLGSHQKVEDAVEQVCRVIEREMRRQPRRKK